MEIYLKVGSSVMSSRGIVGTEEEGWSMARQVNTILERVHRYLLESVHTAQGSSARFGTRGLWRAEGFGELR